MRLRRHLVLAAGMMATGSSNSLAEAAGIEMSSCTRSCYAATVYFLGCNPSDVACACKQQPNLLYYAEPCLAQECRDDDLILSLTSITDLCGDAGGGGGGSGSGSGTSGKVLPPATQTPTGSVFSYKVTAPSNPTTVPGTTVGTRTIAPVTIKAQQAPVTVTPPGTGSSSGGSTVGGSSSGGKGEGGQEGKSNGGSVAWRVEIGAVMLMCVGLGAVLVW
ncbi:hypothetical protein PG993_005635 [Apiospora rasikravindrae]|uniref:CFEM domain-containing protein n=1 Tax=Apiospora rasikravindrae TaxID=990691 RepID=A0ABR1TG37_9PEZI